MEEICILVVPYIGTWIETIEDKFKDEEKVVVPYIGTWIETIYFLRKRIRFMSYLI